MPSYIVVTGTNTEDVKRFKTLEAARTAAKKSRNASIISWRKDGSYKDVTLRRSRKKK